MGSVCIDTERKDARWTQPIDVSGPRARVRIVRAFVGYLGKEASGGFHPVNGIGGAAEPEEQP